MIHIKIANSQLESGTKVMKHPLSYRQASELAAKIQMELEPFCERIEVAGSLRRQKAMVGDLEFVVIPKLGPSMLALPGFQQMMPTSLLEVQLNALVNQGRLIKANNGTKNPSYFIPALYQKGNLFKLELFISSEARWSVEFAIRTGSADFSRKLVTPRADRGYLPSNCRIINGWEVWLEDQRMEFSSERDFIEFCCGKWIPPEERNVTESVSR